MGYAAVEIFDCAELVTDMRVQSQGNTRWRTGRFAALGAAPLFGLCALGMGAPRGGRRTLRGQGAPGQGRRPEPPRQGRARGRRPGAAGPRLPPHPPNIGPSG